MKKSILVLPAILITILFVILVWLGFWQSERAKHKQSLLDLSGNAQQQKPLIIKTHSQITIEQLHRSILLEGHYLPDSQLIYDNQIKNQQAGYFVITPFVIKESSQTVLVNRGFIAWRGQRKIASITIDGNNRKIRASIKNPIKRLVLSQQSIDKKPSFPLLVQSLDIKQLNKVYASLLPVILELHPSQIDGFYRQWQVYYGISPDRHFAYALQWWAMAAVLAIIAVVLILRLMLNTKNNIKSNE